MAEDVEAKAEQLRRQLSSMDLNSDQNLPTISEERDVFYDDGGFVIDNIGFDSVVVVDNLPVVGGEEVRRLESDVRKIFDAVGVIKKDGFSMPVNPRTLENLGHCYIEFTTRQEAELATENINGYKYDKSKLSVTLYDDLHCFVDNTQELESYIAEKQEDDGTESTHSEDDYDNDDHDDDEEEEERDNHDDDEEEEEERETCSLEEMENEDE